MKVWGEDSPEGDILAPVKGRVAQQRWAECRDGVLRVADQAGGPFDGVDMGGKNYHGLDYPLFHMDIRANVRVRVAAYLQKAVQGGPAASPTQGP